MNGYEKYIPKRASFNDVSILELTEWGDYIDLTMTNISNPDILRYDISIKGENVKPDFLIAVYLHESKRFEPHVAPCRYKGRKIRAEN